MKIVEAKRMPNVGMGLGYRLSWCEPWKCEECERLFVEGERAIELHNANEGEYGPSYYCTTCIEAAARLRRT